jgi:phage baseplate assembly protein W
MADLGSDFHGYPDIHPTLKQVSGTLCLVQALARRLETPRGGLFYDPDYGTDLRKFVNQSGVTRAQVVSAIQTECLKDQRVASVTATVEFADTDMTIFISVTPDGESESFSFTLNVGALTVELIDFSGAT